MPSGRSSSTGGRRAGRGTRAWCTAASRAWSRSRRSSCRSNRIPLRWRRCRRRDRSALRPAPHRRRAASRRSDAGRGFRGDRDRGWRRSRRGSRRSGCAIRCATDQAQSAGRQRARHAHEDRDIVAAASSARCGGRSRGCAPETRSVPCARAHLIRRQPGLDGKRLDRRLQETRLLLHAWTIKSHLERFADAEVAVARSRITPLPSCPHATPTVDGERREESGDEIGGEFARRPTT